MTYYRAKRQYLDFTTGNTTIENELLTGKERQRLFKGLPETAFEIVKLSKFKTFHSFGVRFAVND